MNEVGKAHTFTATVSVDPDETGWQPAPDGTVISFSTTGSGAFDPASKACATAGGTGACSIKLTNSSVGKDVVSASVTVIGLTRSTDGVAPNGGPATKRWVDAYIRISPDGFNPVGESHTFDVAFTAQPGDATPVTFNSIAFQLASATLAQGVDFTVLSETCSDKTKWTSSSSGTEQTRGCRIVINSSKVGTIRATANGSVTMGASQDPAGLGATVLRATDGLAKNSGPATKVYYQPAGCTPGFWKQQQHFGYWKDSQSHPLYPMLLSPVDPKTLVSAAFSKFTGQGGQTDGYNASLTLIDALALDNSNGIGQVLRHGTAGLLNAYSKGVLYGFGDDPQAVKDLVDAALVAYNKGDQATVDAAHAKLAKYNELGCTLSGQRFW